MEQSVIAVEDVARALLVFDGTTSAGPDGVHHMLHKSSYSELAFSLSVIHNKSLLSGSILSFFCESLAVSLLRSGSRFAF